ncbi:TetR/AcrR family transcriptional regulator C-terminal domain-containing protein, partial [Kibdelosporangium lantanae]
ESQWRLFHRHPWLLQVSTGRSLLGPNALHNFETHIAVLAGLGLTDVERINLIVMVDSYVSGMARTLIEAEQAAERTGLSDEQFWSAQQPFLIPPMQSGDYPEVASLDMSVFTEFGTSAFEFGLERVLDGVEVLLRGRTG